MDNTSPTVMAGEGPPSTSSFTVNGVHAATGFRMTKRREARFPQIGWLTEPDSPGLGAPPSTSRSTPAAI